MIARHWRGVGIGVLAGVTWLGGLWAVAPLVGGFALDPVAEWIIRRSPGWLSTLAIGLLGFYAKPALIASLALGIVVVSGVAGALWPLETRRGRGAGAGVLALLTVGALAVTGVGVSATAALAFVIALVAPILAVRYLDPAASPAGRRRFLRRVGGVALVGGVSLGIVRTLVGRSLGGEADGGRAGAPLPDPIEPPTGDPSFDFEGMPTAITEPSDHYVIDISVSPPRIDPDEWTLDVEGAVERAYGLGYDELLAHEDGREQPTTMLCISNPVGGDLIGTAHWTGVPLSTLVAAASPTAGATTVVTHAADGYHEAIPLDLVEREDILVAYGMGDRTLTGTHGFPARLLIPGRYGMKMTKWIDRIEVTEADHEAYWEARGWDEAAVVETMSYIRGVVREGDRLRLGGVAFAGLETGVEEIAAVEVSLDDGETWHAATLEEPLAPHTWRRWRFETAVAERGQRRVVTRAIERDGTVQTERETGARPGGATGWHRRVVRL